MNIGLKIRTDMLINALLVERMVSEFLAKLLGISDLNNSKALGNNSGSISFSQKIDLLIEIGALSQDTRKKYQAFMQIRNQFMHNLDAKTYNDCFSCNEGMDKFLIKLYKPNANLNREEQLEYVTKELCGDVLRLTADLMKKIEEKITSEVKAAFNQNAQKVILNGIETVAKNLDEFFEKEAQKGTNFKASRFRSFGSGIKKIIYAVIKKELDKI
jgi:hypothetical protein